MSDCVIFDIDGTLADCSHRLRHLANNKRDWPAFFAEMDRDQPIEPVCWLLLALLDRDTTILLTTGRPENYRTVTEAWLERAGLAWHRLYMRPENDTRPDHVVKSQILDGILADGFEPILVVDDRQSVVDMWRERGLTCLQCAPRDDRTAIEKPGLLTLMVGPSGAGKTTWLAGPDAVAQGIHPSHVLSSDQIRADLCGDFRDQTRNDDVFAALHAAASVRLRHGLPVVVDATNLRRQDRLAVVKLAPEGGRVRYIVIDRPIDEKRRDAGWRAELPIDLIAKHDQTFRSQLKEILTGDGLTNIEVLNYRRAA